MKYILRLLCSVLYASAVFIIISILTILDILSAIYHLKVTNDFVLLQSKWWWYPVFETFKNILIKGEFEFDLPERDKRKMKNAERRRSFDNIKGHEALNKYKADQVIYHDDTYFICNKEHVSTIQHNTKFLPFDLWDSYNYNELKEQELEFDQEGNCFIRNWKS